jgi:hypothetical protein
MPLFNFNVIVLVWQKKTHAQLFEFYLLRISNMLSDIAYCYIVPSITWITV